MLYLRHVPAGMTLIVSVRAAAEEILIFLLLLKVRIDISCELSAK